MESIRIRACVSQDMRDPTVALTLVSGNSYLGTFKRSANNCANFWGVFSYKIESVFVGRTRAGLEFLKILQSKF